MQSTCYQSHSDLGATISWHLHSACSCPNQSLSKLSKPAQVYVGWWTERYSLIRLLVIGMNEDMALALYLYTMESTGLRDALNAQLITKNRQQLKTHYFAYMRLLMLAISILKQRQGSSQLLTLTLGVEIGSGSEFQPGVLKFASSAPISYLLLA